MNNYLSQVGWSSFYRFGSIALSFCIVSVSIDVLGVGSYGVWSVIFSLATFISLFDLGITNSARNELSKEISDGMYSNSREIITTSYYLCFIISVIIFLTIKLMVGFFGEQRIYEFISIPSNYLLLFVGYLSITLFLNVIKSIFYSLHKNHYNLALRFYIDLTFLFTISPLFFNGINKDINYFINSYGMVSVFLLLTFSIWFFYIEKRFKPSFKAININTAKRMLFTGTGFFLIQLSAVVLLSSDRILIINLIDAKSASSYDIIFRLFNIVNVVGGLFLAPFWASFSQANHEKNYLWMKDKVNKLALSFIFVISLSMIVVFNIDFLVNFWVGERLDYTKIEVFSIAIMTSLLYFTSIFSTFCNACGLIKTQMICSVLAALINIPLSIYFVNVVGLGFEGVVLATIIGLLIFGLIGPIITYRWLSKQLKFKKAY